VCTVKQMTPLLTSSGAILVRTVALQAVLLAGTASAAHDGDVAAAAHQVCGMGGACVCVGECERE
jgi:hypothetical protein